MREGKERREKMREGGGRTEYESMRERGRRQERGSMEENRGRRKCVGEGGERAWDIVKMEREGAG